MVPWKQWGPWKGFGAFAFHKDGCVGEPSLERTEQPLPFLSQMGEYGETHVLVLQRLDWHTIEDQAQRHQALTSSRNR